MIRAQLSFTFTVNPDNFAGEGPEVHRGKGSCPRPLSWSAQHSAWGPSTHTKNAALQSSSPYGPLSPLPAVQAPEPKDLLINTTRDRFLLTWTVALPGPQSRWLSSLEYEVVYKRLQDSWEVRTMAGSAPSRGTRPNQRLLH